MPKGENDYNICRIKVDGIVVRYVEDMYSIQMTVEGELPQATIETLASELARKISALENAPFDLKKL